MITVTQVSADGRTLQVGGEELLTSPGLKWVDVEGPTEPQMMKLAELFGLHRLAVEDCLHLDQRPKLEEYPNHLFLVLHGFTRADGNDVGLELQEMHMLILGEVTITVHETSSSAVKAARRKMEVDPAGTFGRGADFIAYMVADALVDQNFPVLEAHNDELEALEETIFEAPHPEQVQHLFKLRRAQVTMRRVLSPARDVVVLLSRRGLPFIQERTTLYFRDIYDHLIRLHEQLDTSRELVVNAKEGYLSQLANRTNEITKQLTIFATIFLPLSFITGFFGQNFDILSQRTFFWLMLFSLVAVPLGLLSWFRYRDWI